MQKNHAMPSNPHLPETRGEAQADRQTMLETVIDLPGKLENKSMKWFIIALGMMISVMAGMAIFYFQKQVMAMQVENIGLRDKLTDYLVTANLSTVSALDRCTAALRENAQVIREVKEALAQLARKP